MIALRQGQYVLTSVFGQPRWQHQEIGPNGIQRRIKVFFGQAESPEPMDKVVSKKRDLKEGDVGHPVVGRNLAQGIIVEQFPNVLFDGGSFGIKPPDSPRMGL